MIGRALRGNGRLVPELDDDGSLLMVSQTHLLLTEIYFCLGGTCSRLGTTKGHPSTSIRASGSLQKLLFSCVAQYLKWKGVDDSTSITNLLLLQMFLTVGQRATRQHRPIWSESCRTRRRCWKMVLTIIIHDTNWTRRRIT